MQLKLKTVASNVSDTTKPEDRTHALTFTGAEAPTTGISVFGVNSLVLTVTAAEAAQYTIGSVYDVALTPAE